MHRRSQVWEIVKGEGHYRLELQTGSSRVLEQSTCCTLDLRLVSTRCTSARLLQIVHDRVHKYILYMQVCLWRKYFSKEWNHRIWLILPIPSKRHCPVLPHPVAMETPPTSWGLGSTQSTMLQHFHHQCTAGFLRGKRSVKHANFSLPTTWPFPTRMWPFCHEIQNVVASFSLMMSGVDLDAWNKKDDPTRYLTKKVGKSKNTNQKYIIPLCHQSSIPFG